MLPDANPTAATYCAVLPWTGAFASNCRCRREATRPRRTPFLAEAVAFARRPGTFALVVECVTGRATAKLTAPQGRHFYGHGAFSDDGRLLFTTENDYDMARGRIGIWDADDAYRRIGEISSNGVGPHDLEVVPGRELLVVANGGIETHPDSGRAKLNLPFMRPNLSFVDFDGEVSDMIEPDPSRHLNSIRHLSVRSDGLVAFGCQWQGLPSEAPASLGLYRKGSGKPVMLDSTSDPRRLEGYAGSVAFSSDGKHVALTSPRGNVAQAFACDSGLEHATVESPDICGVASNGSGFLFTTGEGKAISWPPAGTGAVRSNLAWDNHLIAL